MCTIDGERNYIIINPAPKTDLHQLEWRGKNKNKLETGIYYYAVWVTFNTVDPALRNQKYKGWIHLIC